MKSRLPRSRVTHDRWLVSYADFITLLFAFFVVLFASAKADQKKQMAVAQAIDEAFRSLGMFSEVSRRPAKNVNHAAAAEQAAMPMNIVMGDDVLSPAQVKSDLDKLRQDLEQRLSNQIAQHTVAIRMGRNGLVISLREAGFFASGSATPRDESLSALREIGARVGRSAYDVRVEGHTDNVPIHTFQFDSNWELSSARATNIARLFLDQHAIAPEHLSTAGYAEFHPVANNQTAEGRAMNRRVDLVVLPRSEIDLSSPEPTADQQLWRKITDSD
jgi:chemotaxis protein MotB